MNINKLMKHYKGMKKNCFYGRGVPFHLKKCLLIMRLCLFFMLVLQIGVSASGYTQQRVSLSMQDVTLEHVLKELKKQTEVGVDGNWFDIYDYERCSRD